MIKIMFVCHGNICRSPMAEFVMRDIVKKLGREKEFYIASSATSCEEIGNPVHIGTKRKLNSKGIDTLGKYAVQFTKSDFNSYDYIIGMDSAKIKNIIKIAGLNSENKAFRLLDCTQTPRDISDPWYTGNFDATYDDIFYGCNMLLDHIDKHHNK